VQLIIWRRAKNKKAKANGIEERFKSFEGTEIRSAYTEKGKVLFSYSRTGVLVTSYWEVHRIARIESLMAGRLKMFGWARVPYQAFRFVSICKVMSVRPCSEIHTVASWMGSGVIVALPSGEAVGPRNILIEQYLNGRKFLPLWWCRGVSFLGGGVACWEVRRKAFRLKAAANRTFCQI
jgi:hypothetical protein